MWKIFLLISNAFFATSHAKYYATPCQFIQDLVNVTNVSPVEAAKWSCAIRSSTNYDDGSFKGIFGIGAEWWCSPSGGGGCNIKCSALVDDDIADDYRCAKHIYTTYGNSWDAWPAVNYCSKQDLLQKLENCPLQRAGKVIPSKVVNTHYTRNHNDLDEEKHSEDEHPPEVPEDDD